MDTTWVTSGYLEQLSNMNIHYQNITVLILGAVTFLLYNNITKMHYFWSGIFLIAAFTLCVFNLYLGLMTYQDILGTFLDFTANPNLVKLHKIGYINWQLSSCLCALFFLCFAFVDIWHHEKNKMD